MLLFSGFYIELFRARRKVGPGGPDPGRKSGRDLRERGLYKNAPQRVLRGEKVQKLQEMRKSAGKCGKVGETAKSEKQLSSGSGPLGARPTWPMGKKYFLSTHLKNDFFRAKTIFMAWKTFFVEKTFFENFVQGNCFSSWEDCQELDTPDLGLCLPRVVTETQLQTKNRRVCVLCEGALASEAQK